MALTSAEKQRNYRERQRIKLKQEMDALRQQAQQPAQPNPFADCTPAEVEHLRQCLKQYRAQAAKKAAARRELDEVMKKNPKVQEAVKQRDERLAARAELKERLKPKAGTYWCLTWGTPTTVESITVTVGAKGGIKATTAKGHPLSCRFDTFYSKWQINGRDFYATKEEADYVAACRSIPRSNPFAGNPRPYADKTIAELRALRSEHHPDKGNAHADPTLYQQAVEELDRRR